MVELLMSNPGRVFSIDDIYESVWEEPSFKSDNTVSVHIRKIREKIESNPKKPKYLKVVWVIGYKMEKKSLTNFCSDFLFRLMVHNQCFIKTNEYSR
ncbi:winged helix-turn-helix domain-containing protein [Vagococcus fluvialis]